MEPHQINYEIGPRIDHPGLPTEADKKEKGGSRLYIICDGKPLLAKGLNVLTSKADADKANELWLKKQAESSGTEEGTIPRKRYVPLTLKGTDGTKTVYVDINSSMKHLLLFRGQVREQELLKNMENDEEFGEVMIGESDRDDAPQGNTIKEWLDQAVEFYLSHHVTAEDRRRDLYTLLKRPIPVKSLEAAQFEYDSTHHLFDPKIHFEKNNKNYRELSEKRMACSVTIAINEERQPKIFKLAKTNWNNADREIRQWLQEKGKVLTIDDIKKLNALLGENFIFNGHEPGDFRIAGHEAAGGEGELFLSGQFVEKDMQGFIEWLNKELKVCDENPGKYAVVLAAKAAQYLISIHPFYDGNGRTTSMIMDYILERYGLPPAALDDKISVFNTEPGKLVNLVREGIERSCKTLGLKSPFKEEAVRAAEEEQKTRQEE